MKPWLGFGGCKFEKDGITATFSGGVGKFTFTPIQKIYDTVNHDLSSRLKGYRLTFEISELINIDSDDYVQYQNLALILTAMINADEQETLVLTPRDDSSITPLLYTCILTSNVSAQDLHRVNTGQKLNLKFSCIYMQSCIPATFGDTLTGDYWDGTDTYWDGTDTYIDDL